MTEKRVGKVYIDTDSMEKDNVKSMMNHLYGKNRPAQGKTYMVPSELKVERKIGVTLISVSEKGYSDTVYFETDSLLSATRILNTYNPKRGYKLAKSTFEEVGVLV